MHFLLLPLAILIFLFVYIRYLERVAVFFPDRVLEQEPASVGLACEEAFIPTADGETLYGWWFSHEKPRATLLFFHGNAGNISHRLGKVVFFHDQGFQVLLVDYRGYGRSTGRPTEKGIYADAEAVWRYATEERNIKPKDLIAYGASLGGAVAVDLASRKEVGGLIVDSTFSSAKDMARMMFPWAPTWLMSVEFHSVQKIKKVHVPKMIFHSEEDETVPYALGQKLFEAAGEPKFFVTTSGGHNDEHVLSREVFEKNMEAFMDVLQAAHD